jgi:DDE superfamily endonuclease
VGHPLSEGRVPFCCLRSEGERSHGMPGGRTALSESKKRARGAAERDEFLRLIWRAEMDDLDPWRLVLVDEMGTHTSLAPLYAYAPIGERAFFEAPRNRGTNTTLLASLNSEGAGPSMAVEGATNKEVFEAYLEHSLVPALRPGQLG